MELADVRRARAESHQRSRHCFPERVPTHNATADHFFGPSCSTARRSSASSSALHGWLERRLLLAGLLTSSVTGAGRASRLASIGAGRGSTTSTIVSPSDTASAISAHVASFSASIAPHPSASASLTESTAEGKSGRVVVTGLGIMAMAETASSASSSFGRFAGGSQATVSISSRKSSAVVDGKDMQVRKRSEPS